MKADPKLTISIFTTKWGHASIAKAVEDSIDTNKFKIYFNNIKIDRLFGYSYNTMYKLFPALFRIPFKMADNGTVAKSTTKYLYSSYHKTIMKHYFDQKPNIVINTYFAFNSVFEKLLEEHKFLFINIITDPRTFSSIVVSKIAYNFAFDKHSVLECRKMGIVKERCIQSGWFTRKEFTPTSDKDTARKALELSPDLFTICVVGGSEGTYSILKILPGLFRPPQPIQVVIICGNNKSLKQITTAFSELSKLGNGNKLHLKVIGYSNLIDRYIQASDLVIGKAGPNLLFETVAGGVPFFAISHISGQEDGNLDIIRQYKLGYVEENQIKAIKLLNSIITNPKQLEKFTKPLAKMAMHNRRSAEIINSFIANNNGQSAGSRK